MIIISCGARKSQVQKENIEAKQELQQETTTTETRQAVFSDVKANDAQELIIEPVNNEKPLMIVEPSGKKTILYNGRISAKKSKSHSTLSGSVKTNREIVTNIKEKAEVKAVVKHKETERKTSYGWPWWLLLLIPLGYGIYKIRSRAI